MNNEFIGYLNSLHNAGANNENAIAEVSIGSKYFDEMLVKRPVDEFVRKLFIDQKPSFTIITGHAGDGKTSMLIQLLKSCGYEATTISSRDEFIFEGKKMFFIKDFSEFSDEERSSLFRECESKVTQGIHIVLIANTGPLINTITKRFSKEITSSFLTLVQDGKGAQQIIEGISYHIINIAKLENHDFIRPYIEKITNKVYYETCESCENKDVCPIIFNRNLVQDNPKKFISFLEDHFIWQNEHSIRSTVRQIIALISYSITGGLGCSNINASLGSEFKFKHLISNNLFGYSACKPDGAILELQSIKDLALREYDGKQLPCDEAFHIKRDFKVLDGNLQKMLTDDFYEKMVSTYEIHNFQKALRRMYILFNIETNEDTLRTLKKVLFSNNFPEFVDLIKYPKVAGNNKVRGDLKKVIIKGIANLFLEGENASNNYIIVTLKRESSIEQVVQIELGRISIDSLLLEKSKIEQFSSNLETYEILLRSEDDTIHTTIGLPLINYFEQLQSGLLSSNIDPHLSHGIGALKAQITTYASKKDYDDQIRFQSLNIKGWKPKKLEKNNDKWLIG